MARTVLTTAPLVCVHGAVVNWSCGQQASSSIPRADRSRRTPFRPLVCVVWWKSAYSQVHGVRILLVEREWERASHSAFCSQVVRLRCYIDDAVVPNESGGWWEITHLVLWIAHSPGVRLPDPISAALWALLNIIASLSKPGLWNEAWRVRGSTRHLVCVLLRRSEAPRSLRTALGERRKKEKNVTCKYLLFITNTCPGSRWSTTRLFMRRATTEFDYWLSSAASRLRHPRCRGVVGMHIINHATSL